MNVDDFVQLVMLSYVDGIQGKTKLQKTVYFLGELSGVDLLLGYHAHYFGPFSEDVADAISRMKALGLIDQTITGFENARYDFRLNDDGRKVAELKKAMHDDRWCEICEAKEKLTKAGDLDYKKLSVAAKVHYMLDRREGATANELKTAARRFGWNVIEEDVVDAGKFLNRLGLVEIAEATH